MSNIKVSWKENIFLHLSSFVSLNALQNDFNYIIIQKIYSC